MNTAAKRKTYRLRLWETQAGLCHWCGERMSLNRRKTGEPARDFATFEHIKRREDGGDMSPENIVLAHYKCNVQRNAEHQGGIIRGPQPLYIHKRQETK